MTQNTKLKNMPKKVGKKFTYVISTECDLRQWKTYSAETCCPHICCLKNRKENIQSMYTLSRARTLKLPGKKISTSGEFTLFNMLKAYRKVSRREKVTSFLAVWCSIHLLAQIWLNIKLHPERYERDGDCFCKLCIWICTASVRSSLFVKRSCNVPLFRELGAGVLVDVLGVWNEPQAPAKIKTIEGATCKKGTWWHGFFSYLGS